MDKSLSGSLEALLFLHGEPMAVKKIAAVLRCEESDIRSALEALTMHLGGADRGLRVIED